jgi:DNA polymerase-3 subunit delta'
LTINAASGFSAISNQETAVRRLSDLIRSGNIPHALLFTGLDGIGKKKTAMALATALNCHTISGQSCMGNEPIDPCGICRPCKKIAAGHHPDIIIVEPEQSRIKISAIRDLGNALAVKPYEAMTRVVVIDQAQAMNPQAGNALLKLLEEPPAKTILILIAVNTYSLLPTIVSRCQQISFRPIPFQALAKYLGQKGIPSEQAEILSQLANGSFANAERLADTDWLNRREWIIRIVEHLGGNRQDDHRAALCMTFSEMLAKDRDAIPDVLALITSWFRDVAVVREGSKNIINQDLLPRIERAAQHCRTKTVLTHIGHLETARKKIEANANIRLTIDIMLMNLFPGFNEE